MYKIIIVEDDKEIRKEQEYYNSNYFQCNNSIVYRKYICNSYYNSRNMV